MELLSNNDFEDFIYTLNNMNNSKSYSDPIQFAVFSVRLCKKYFLKMDSDYIRSKIEFAEEFETIDHVLNEALNSYFIMLGAETPSVDNKTETLDIYNFTSFEKDGDTIYVAYGNLTHYPYGNSTPFSENTTVWFTQDYLNITQWQIVIFLQVGDVLEMNITEVNEIFYCLEIISVT